eukprot:368454_1
MAHALSLLLSLILFCASNADVYNLDESNFDEHTSTGLWYLEFYAPWCGHCKKFAPIYEEASNDPALKDINFGAIDATSSKQLAKRFDVSRFPTIKFFEDDLTYKFTGARTLESLKTMGRKMQEPPVKPLDTKPSHLDALNDRFSVSFLYIINDQNTNINHQTNNDIFHKTAMMFRPEIPCYSITYSDFKTQGYLNNKRFMQKVLRLTKQQMEDKFTAQSSSSILAITSSTPSINELNTASFTVDTVQAFIERNRYSPVIELKLGNYKDLVDNSQYFGIIFVDELYGASKKLIDGAERLMIDNSEWNENSFDVFKQWISDNEDSEDREQLKENRPYMYQLIVAWCNATQYKEWASHTFGITEESLPLFLLYSPKQDGYWKYDANEDTMIVFLNDAFSGELEITYTRNWIARKAMKVERWLNELSGWQIALVFIGVFVVLCAIMVLLDYCCTPALPPIKDD